VNIWQRYKQKRGSLVHFARLANTLLKDEETARDNHVLACNFAKYLPFYKISLTDSAINLSCGGIFNIHLTTNLPSTLLMKKI